MVIGDRLKTLRRAKNISQGDIEKRTGLLRCYVSRVENGHTVPASKNTIEKLARALEVPLYRIFTDDENVTKPNLPPEVIRSRAANSKQDRYLQTLSKLLARMSDERRRLLYHMAAKMANRA